MKTLWKRYFPLIILAAVLLICVVVYACVRLFPSPTRAVEGYIRASMEYDADDLLRYASDYQLTMLSGNGDLTKEQLKSSIKTAFAEAAQYREDGKIRFESRIKEQPAPDSERYAELLETYRFKADPDAVQAFAVVEAKCYIDGKYKKTYTAVAVRCGGKWYYGFND